MLDAVKANPGCTAKQVFLVFFNEDRPLGKPTIRVALRKLNDGNRVRREPINKQSYKYYAIE